MGYRTTMYMVANEGYVWQNIYITMVNWLILFCCCKSTSNWKIDAPIRAVAMGYTHALNNDTRTTSPTKAPNWNSTQFSIKELPISP